jgi:hypothetical protein
LKLIDDVGIPEPIMRALERDPYNKGESDISVTGLLKPPIMRALESHYDEQLFENASGRIYALLGKAVHSILEMADLADSNRYITERRFFIEKSGWKVSGQVDLIDLSDRTLHDFKVCSRWVGVFGAKEEWEQQLNMYRILAKANGVDVDSLKIHAIYRDWSKGDMRKKPDYPKKQIETFDLQVWNVDRAWSFLEERIALHQQADELLRTSISRDGLQSIVCTPEERWERGKGFAVVKSGRDKAIRVLESRAEAESWISRNRKEGERLMVEERIETPTRCLDYCSVKNYCPFGARLPNE